MDSSRVKQFDRRPSTDNKKRTLHYSACCELSSLELQLCDKDHSTIKRDNTNIHKIIAIVRDDI